MSHKAKPIPLKYGRRYHIYNRGNNRQTIFFAERNYHHFLHLYAKYIMPIANTYAYCLLSNHFHFFVRLKAVEEIHPLKISSPSQQFGNLFNAYAKGINKVYRRTGSLMEKPFGRVEVTTETYFKQLMIYIHQNPQKHGLVPDFRDWPFSSYHTLLSSKPTRLDRQATLTCFEGAQKFVAAHGTILNDHPLAPDDFD